MPCISDSILHRANAFYHTFVLCALSHTFLHATGTAVGSAGGNGGGGGGGGGPGGDTPGKRAARRFTPEEDECLAKAWVRASETHRGIVLPCRLMNSSSGRWD